MNTSFTLKEIAHPCSPISSTGRASISVRGEQANSFSFPPILYYAIKAKILCRLKIKNEEEASLHQGLNIKDVVLSEMREIARTVHHDIAMSSDQNRPKVNLSASVQSRALYSLLNDKENNLEALLDNGSVPINSTTSQINITLPKYLFRRLSALLASDKAAKLRIHSIIQETKSTLIKEGVIEGKNKVIGPAGNSSWSRKLHNQIICELIEMSGIKEVTSSPSIFEIKMLRDEGIEIKTPKTS